MIFEIDKEKVKYDLQIGKQIAEILNGSENNMQIFKIFFPSREL